MLFVLQIRASSATRNPGPAKDVLIILSSTAPSKDLDWHSPSGRSCSVAASQTTSRSFDTVLSSCWQWNAEIVRITLATTNCQMMVSGTLFRTTLKSSSSDTDDGSSEIVYIRQSKRQERWWKRIGRCNSAPKIEKSPYNERKADRPTCATFSIGWLH